MSSARKSSRKSGSVMRIITLEDLHQHVLDLWGKEDGIKWIDEPRAPAANPESGTIRIHPICQAARATRRIAFLFVAGEDPVKLGLVLSLARPGGNLTRVNFFGAEMAARRMELRCVEPLVVLI